MISLVTLVAPSLALLPQAARPAAWHRDARTIRRPLPPSGELAISWPLDSFFLGLFRWTLQQKTGVNPHPSAGFDGMVGELQSYQRTHSLEEQAECSEQVLAALSGPFPEIWKGLTGSFAWSPAALAFFAPFFLHFLVGDMTTTQRADGDPRGGGVLVHRCAVLEKSECKGLCVNMCKRPTERFFAARWGVPLHMQPNFETLECQLSFGVEPPALSDDPSLPVGCLSYCPIARGYAPDGSRSSRTIGGEACEGETETLASLCDPRPYES